jgi:hypothetical protein
VQWFYFILFYLFFLKRSTDQVGLQYQCILMIGAPWDGAHDDAQLMSAWE